MTTTDLEVAGATPVFTPNYGALQHYPEFAAMAEAICKAQMVPDALRGSPGNTLAVMLAGHELGFAPMASLQQIDIIKGRPSLSAEAMRALILRSGHKFRVKASATAATVTCRRKDWAEDDEDDEVTFTIEDAKLAGLTGGENWKKHPRAMLTARATSEAARLHFSDVLNGISYVPEEIEAFSSPAPRAAAPAPARAPQAEPFEYETAPASVRVAPPVIADDDGVIIDAEVVEDVAAAPAAPAATGDKPITQTEVNRLRKALAKNWGITDDKAVLEWGSERTALEITNYKQDVPRLAFEGLLEMAEQGPDNDEEQN